MRASPGRSVPGRVARQRAALAAPRHGPWIRPAPLARPRREGRRGLLRPKDRPGRLARPGPLRAARRRTSDSGTAAITPRRMRRGLARKSGPPLARDPLRGALLGEYRQRRLWRHGRPWRHRGCRRRLREPPPSAARTGSRRYGQYSPCGEHAGQRDIRCTGRRSRRAGRYRGSARCCPRCFRRGCRGGGEGRKGILQPHCRRARDERRQARLARPGPRAGCPAPPGALGRDQYPAESSGVTAEVTVQGHLGSRVLNWDSSRGFEYFEYFVCLNFGVQCFESGNGVDEHERGSN